MGLPETCLDMGLLSVACINLVCANLAAMQAASPVRHPGAWQRVPRRVFALKRGDVLGSPGDDHAVGVVALECSRSNVPFVRSANSSRPETFAATGDVAGPSWGLRPARERICRTPKSVSLCLTFFIAETWPRTRARPVKTVRSVLS